MVFFFNLVPYLEEQTREGGGAKQASGNEVQGEAELGQHMYVTIFEMVG